MRLVNIFISKIKFMLLSLQKTYIYVIFSASPIGLCLFKACIKIDQTTWFNAHDCKGLRDFFFSTPTIHLNQLNN